MLRVTFYSYKGGVGRTLALLNVAAILAQAGRRVVAVDLDLEAPGFGLSGLTRHEPGERGVSDFLLDREAGGDTPVTGYAYPILAETCEDRLHLLSVGTRAGALIRRLPVFYADPAAAHAGLFQRLVAEIAAAFEPDYLLFDSRTGKADVAGVCTVELPQVLVAVCGLNEQNVAGMGGMLTALANHPARVEPVATMLVLSPVPRPDDLGLPSVEALFARDPRGIDAAELARERRSNPLIDALYRAQVRLLTPIWHEFETTLRPHFPGVDRHDLFHLLPYDPAVPLMDELQLTRDVALSAAYRRLAWSLTRMNADDAPLDMPMSRRPPILIAA